MPKETIAIASDHAGFELKSQLKQDAQDNSSKKLQKIAQLAQILMSINNLYKKCQFRADKPILKFKTFTLYCLNEDFKILSPRFQDAGSPHC